MERAGDGSPPTSTRIGAGMLGPGSPRDVAAAAAGRPQWALFLALAASIAVIDQVVKAWVVSNFAFGVVTPIVGDAARISLTQNTGALFGLFRDSAILFAIVSLAVLAVIVVYEARAGRVLIVTVALGLLLGGAIGNLIDRLRLGYVVDFVDLGIGTWRWYTFNVADAAISTAVLLLILIAVVPGLGQESRGG